jgi:hypothetical protein
LMRFSWDLRWAQLDILVAVRNELRCACESVSWTGSRLGYSSKRCRGAEAGRVNCSLSAAISALPLLIKPGVGGSAFPGGPFQMGFCIPRVEQLQLP